MVQGIGPSFLAGELRSHKLHGMAKKKQTRYREAFLNLGGGYKYDHFIIFT